MRKQWSAIASVVLLCSLIPSLAHGQVAIELSPSSGGQNCGLLNDSGPGLRTVFVKLAFNPGAVSARFRVVPEAGVTMTYLSETTPYPSTGNTQNGIAICFNGCLYSYPTIVTITYMSYATDEPCSLLRVVPHPESEIVEVQKCDGSIAAAYSIDMMIWPPFPMEPCYCPPARHYLGNPGSFDCLPLATEETTWGHVKALYKE